MDIKNVCENQSFIFNMLKNSIKQDRLSHAYLFYGNSGTGKKEMAYALACMLYNIDDIDFESETSKVILEGNHLNVDYIGLLDNKKMISKEQISSLEDEFSKTSLVKGPRVYIVDGIDTASNAAQNSLLKFIEEPINNEVTVGIFIAEELSNVVSTIKSRCITIHFNDIPVTNYLKELESKGYNELNLILASNLTSSKEEIEKLQDDKDFNLTVEYFLEFISIYDNVSKVKFYIESVNFFQDYKRLDSFLSFIILFLTDACKTGSQNLILTPIYDKINLYKTKNDKRLKEKLSFVLELKNRLKVNVLPKNILHELIVNI